MAEATGPSPSLHPQESFETPNFTQELPPSQEPNPTPVAAEPLPNSRHATLRLRSPRVPTQVETRPTQPAHENPPTNEASRTQTQKPPATSPESAQGGQAAEESSQEQAAQRQTTVKKLGKCFNAQCTATRIHRRVKSKIQTSRYRSLCERCYNNYVNSQFCEFCEQIYGETINQDDDSNWIGCDSCERWNHISCEKRNRLKDADIIKRQNGKYQCLACSNVSRTNHHPTKQQQLQHAAETNARRGAARTAKAPQPVEENPYQYDKQYKRKPCRQPLEDKNRVFWNENPQSINIFNKIREPTPSLDQMLNTINFKLGISDQQIREDLTKMRSKQTQKSSNQPSPTEEGEQDKKNGTATKKKKKT